MKRLLILFLYLLLPMAVANAASNSYSPIEKGIITMYSHHEIHDGNSYRAVVNKTLNSGQKIQLLVNTSGMGTAAMHVVPELRSSGESYLEVYRDTSVSALGSVVESSNHNDLSTNVSPVALTNAPTITGIGNIIPGFTEHIGNGQTTGGSSERGSEIMLAANKLYLMNVVSEANSNDVSLHLDYYVSKDYY